MKMKSIATWSKIAALTAMFACALPANADENIGGELGADPSMMLSDNSSSQSALQAPTDGGMATGQDGSLTNTPSADNMNLPGATANNDQGGPDTATGDDDY